jgi:ABC-type lipoprotein release transport system permease subunit
MSKHLKILEFVLSSLLRRKIKNLGIVAVFSFVVFILASILFLTHAFKTESLAILEGAPELIVHKIAGGRHDLTALRYGDEIAKIPGVGRVLPRYWGYYYDASTGANYTVMGATEAPRSTLELVRGSFIEAGQRGVCVLGEGVAEVRLAGVNGTVPIMGADGELYRFKVVGVFRDPSALLTNDLILVAPEDIREIFDMPPDVATDIVVQVFNPSEVANVAKKIKYRFPELRPITRTEILRTYEALFSWRSGLVILMFVGALVAFGILAWDKATGLSGEEKKEIGILKAIGWETSDILALKFWEGAVLSLVSFLAGLIAAYAHVFFFGASVFAPALKGWSVIFPDFRLLPYIDPYQIFVLIFLTVVPYIAATIVPSWKTAITDPDIVMRG